MRQINRNMLLQLIAANKAENITEQIIHVMFLEHGKDLDIIEERLEKHEEE